jgi:hypothetical protein
VPPTRGAFDFCHSLFWIRLLQNSRPHFSWASAQPSPCRYAEWKSFDVIPIYRNACPSGFNNSSSVGLTPRQKTRSRRSPNCRGAKRGITAASAVGFRARTRPPGTEFLDAETGPQISPTKWVSAHRDKNPEMSGRKSPQKRASLASCRKRAVCEDWMVEVVGHKLATHHPVIEPVSEIRILAAFTWLEARWRSIAQLRRPYLSRTMRASCAFSHAFSRSRESIVRCKCSTSEGSLVPAGNGPGGVLWS